MIHLTEKAILKIKEISDSEGVGHYMIRVKILGGGCNGFTQDMQYDNQISEMDEVFEMNGVKIIVDFLSHQYLDEVVIDYLEDLMSSGFKFSGGDIKSTCGCGNSFSF